MFRSAFSALVAAPVVCLLAASPASALTFTGNVPCMVGDIELATGVSSLDCEGAYDGNDSNQISNTVEVFGLTGWEEILKVDGDSGQDSNATLDLSLNVMVDQGSGGTSGTWSLTGNRFAPPPKTPEDQYMAVLKGGPSFSAYKLGNLADTLFLGLDPAGNLGGIWTTDGIETGSGEPNPGLSHFAVYRVAGDPDDVGDDPGEVPLPAGIWLLLGGLGVFGAIARRRAA